MLRSCDGQEFFVHRECLRESPFLRRAFAKAQSIVEEDLIVTFSQGSLTDEGDSDLADDPAEDGDYGFRDKENSEESRDVTFVGQLDASTAPADLSSEPGKAEVHSPSSLPAAAVDRAASAGTASTGFGAGTAASREAAEETPFSSIAPRKTSAPPLVLTETLQLDPSITIGFPNTNGATLDTIIAYLYYKHRYERKPLELRLPFTVPSASAIAVMKIAHLLEC